jgi:hypothetical protein
MRKNETIMKADFFTRENRSDGSRSVESLEDPMLPVDTYVGYVTTSLTVTSELVTGPLRKLVQDP